MLKKRRTRKRKKNKVTKIIKKKKYSYKIDNKYQKAKIKNLGEGNGNTLQFSCLENPRDGGAWWGCCLWGRTESDMTEAT